MIENDNKHEEGACSDTIRVGTYPNAAKNQKHDSQQYRIYDIRGKSVTLCGNGGGMGAKTGLYAVPINPLKSGKSRCMTSGYANKGIKHILDSNASDNPHKQTFDSVAVPVNTTPDGKAQTIKAQYQKNNVSNFCCYKSTYGATGVAEVVPVYATPVAFDDDGRPTRAISGSDRKEYAVYEVRDGKITVLGKQYDIDLEDGFYIIRKLTVSECKRLQTIPEWYIFPVSDTQAYKMLGNGWTRDVITHLVNACLQEVTA